MTDDKENQTLNDSNEFELEGDDTTQNGVDEDFDDLDDLEEFDDEIDDFEDNNDYTPKKSGSKKGIIFIAVLIALGAGGYYFFGSSLLGGNPKIPQKSTQTAGDIPPAPTMPGQTSQDVTHNSQAPLPPPPMPTPIGPDTGADIISTSDATIADAGTIAEPLSEESPVPVPPPSDMAEDSADIMDDPIVAPAEEEPTPFNTEESTESDVDVVETETLADDMGTSNIIEEDVTPAPEIIEDANLDSTEEELVTEDELAPVTSKTEQTQTPSSPITEQRIDALQNNIQSLATRVDDISQAVLASTAKSDTADNALTDADKETLATLSQQMIQVTHRLDQLSEKIAELGKEAKTPVPAPVKQKTVEVKAKPKAEQQAAPAAKPNPTPKKAPVTSTNWTLRSAQPGVAWLSKGKTNEMQRYVTGQSVPGIGKIQSISQENGRWIVKTTGGTIKQ